MAYTVPLFERLVEQFQRLPGIGQKSAERIANHLMTLPAEETDKIAQTITEARKRIHYCTICGSYTEGEVCSICSDASRDRSVITVVEKARDVMSLEKVSELRCLYHVLSGLLSPMTGVSPEQLRVKELLDRLGDGSVKELIMATNATVEGEATAMYVSKLVKPLGVRVTRLAYGIPVGGDLEYADEVTLSMSLQGRRDM